MSEERDFESILSWAQREPLRLNGDVTLVDALAEMHAMGVDHVVVSGPSHGLFGLAGLRRQAADSRSLRGDWQLEALAQRPPRWSPDEELPDLVRKLRDLSAVLVRSDEGEEAVLTAQAVLEALAIIAEPFLHIAGIEASIRAVLDVAIPVDERPAVFENLLKRVDGSTPEALDELSMGDYENIINAKKLWPRFVGAFRNREIAGQKLASARRIRNQLFHFRGALDPEDTRELAQLRWWFEQARMRAARDHLAVVETSRNLVAG